MSTGAPARPKHPRVSLLWPLWLVVAGRRVLPSFGSFTPASADSSDFDRTLRETTHPDALYGPLMTRRIS
jgi:hypothetical protein